jgi:hypothetical protein
LFLFSDVAVDTFNGFGLSGRRMGSSVHRKLELLRCPWRFAVNRTPFVGILV